MVPLAPMLSNLIQNLSASYGWLGLTLLSDQNIAASLQIWDANLQVPERAINVNNVFQVAMHSQARHTLKASNGVHHR